MRLVESAVELREAIGRLREPGRPLGFVPTMGALHEGHLTLVDTARARGAAIVASVFVNPLQFGPTEDLAKYPRDLARDRDLLAGRGVDLLFAPSAAEMYRERPLVTIDPGSLGSRWEGAVRPGHFAGVLTVVAKLLHLVEPDFACFGQKDIQQVTLIRRMVGDLDWPVEVVTVPTVREPDGLALSSRNGYLAPDDRRRATVLSRALAAVGAAWRGGAADAEALDRVARAVFAEEPTVVVDYIAVADPQTLEPVATASAGTIIAIAARVGPTRLIDNVILGAAG
ncbi:MAG: pantoate--beta-alanine ligase [Gemmatimonadales bacterium]